MQPSPDLPWWMPLCSAVVDVPRPQNYPSSKMKLTLVSTDDRLLVFGHFIIEEIF